MIESDTITPDREKALFAEWFATVTFPDAEFGDTLPPLEEEEDDEERLLRLNAESRFADVNTDALLKELRKRDPDNPF